MVSRLYLGSEVHYPTPKVLVAWLETSHCAFQQDEFEFNTFLKTRKLQTLSGTYAYREAFQSQQHENLSLRKNIYGKLYLLSRPNISVLSSRDQE